MGITTGIAWTDHTFNPWWGCQRVSPGCEHCYAETFSKRVGLKLWGPTNERRMFGDKHWLEPHKWNLAAMRAGVRRRVFCASMADVFEDRPELAEPRARLHALVRRTPWLDWQLLTKRPENADRLWAAALVDGYDGSESIGPVWDPNVWLGTTVEDVTRGDERVHHLLAVPGPRVRFLSMEPLLEAASLRNFAIGHDARGLRVPWPWIPVAVPGLNLSPAPRTTPMIDWVIIGGESGPGARRFDLGWAVDLVAELQAAHVPVFVKQLGAKPTFRGHQFAITSRKGDDLTEWPESLRIQQFPTPRTEACP